MRLALILLAVGAVVLLIAKAARAAGSGKYYVDAQGNYRAPDGSLVEAKYVPPPAPGNPKDPRGGVAGFCERIFSYNGEAISQVPDKNAQYVRKGNDLLSDINCGAVGIAEKAVGAAIVTPAKKLWNAVF